MYFDKLMITPKENGKTHFSVSTGEARVDVHIIDTEEYKKVLREDQQKGWVGNEFFSQKTNPDYVTVRIYVSDSNLVYYDIRTSEYKKAVNSFLAQIGGL